MSVTEPDHDLHELAQAYGVATEFWDWQGIHRLVPRHTIAAVLAALGADTSSPEAIEDARERHRNHAWSSLLPGCIVHRQGAPVAVAVHVTHGDPVELWIELEDGGQQPVTVQLEDFTAPRRLGGCLIGQASFQLPSDLPLGYHVLHARAGVAATGGDADANTDDTEDTGVTGGVSEASTTLIVTPDWLGFPAHAVDERTWGLTTQLYSVRSRRSWGIGDLGDLRDLAGWAAAEHQAGFVLINPLHAAEPVAPMEPSPYLPTTRRFANPIYLRIEQIPEYAYLLQRQRECVEALHTRLQKELEGLDYIERDIVWAAKREALQLIYEVTRGRGRDLAFAAFRQREGHGLRDYATWCAIAEVHGSNWHHWPQSMRRPDSPAVLRFRDEHAAVVDFHAWMQWQLDEQLAAAQAGAVGAGMSLGIVHDLAVGVNPNGAEAWAQQHAFAQGISVGAPPDAFNQNGQDWSQPPWRPDRLRELGYTPFRDMVSSVLRHAGGIRVDHIIGLFRLWWVPAGLPPTAGTYVRYDHEAMIGILALEAHRAGALVIGEDLGTVEPWARDYLHQRGILGTSILWFEFEHQAGGAPLRPEWWREYCLASVTTHDLPPTSGYLAGDHVRLRDSLGLLTIPVEQELAMDEGARQAWLNALRERGALAEDASVEETVLALHRYLAWTQSKLLSLALTDAVGDRRTQNQPGTVNEYPNWRIPLSGPDGRAMGLEEVFTSPRTAALAQALRDSPVSSNG